MARRKVEDYERSRKKTPNISKKRLVKKSSKQKEPVKASIPKRGFNKAFKDVDYGSDSEDIERKPIMVNNQQDNSDMSEEEFMKFMEEQRKQKKKQNQKKDKTQKQESPQKSLDIFTNDKNKPCTGMRYVLTGIFHCVDDRKQIQKLITNLGGKVTSAVSGVTNVLLYGHKLEDGRDSSESNKYKKSEKLGKLLVNEEQFSDKLKEITGKSLSEHLGVSMVQKSKQKQQYIEQYKKRFEVEQNQNQDLLIEDLLETETNSGQLWSDKYAPKKPEQILGNQSVIQNLTKWLKEWKTEKKSNLPNQKQNSKAVLLFGSPGIGKTTAATVISKSLGFDYIVQNASNQRNKASVNAMLNGLKDNQTIGHFLVNKSNKKRVNEKANENCVIIMDEIDGMTGDRGGVGELLQQIKGTQQPIICICNNNQATALRTFKTYCYSLEFKEPTTEDIFGILEVILINEVSQDFWNLIDKSILSIIIQTCQNDIRQIINYLQMWLKGIDLENLHQSRDIKELSYITSKDMLKFNTPFAAVKQILNTKLSKNTNFHELKRLYFTDYNVMGVYIFENYLPYNAKSKETLDSVEEAIESIAIGDIIDNQIQQERDYSLLHSQCYFSTIRPALVTQRFVAYPQFPQYLGRFQSRKKRERILYEMQDCLLNVCHQVSNDQDTILMLEILCEHITTLMNNGDFQELYSVYQSLNLQPNMLKDNLKILMDFHSKSQTLSKINAKKKSKFTQYYNSKQVEEVISKKGKNKQKGNKQKKNKKTQRKNESQDDMDESQFQSMEDSFIVDDYVF